MRDVFELKLKEVKLYQLLDSDGDVLGIVASPIGTDKMGDLVKEWVKASNDLIGQGKNPDPTADGFVEYVESKELVAGRVFVEDEIVADF